MGRAVDAEESDLLQRIVEGVESETGSSFFRSLVRHLATALDAKYAFVSELTPDRQRFRTLALWGNGAFLENVEVPLSGTPCEAVLRGEYAHYADCLQQQFPEDAALKDWSAQSYCGVPLMDSEGAVVGHLAIIDDKPMPEGPRGLSIMRIFATRARAEIERLRMEDALRLNEARYRDLYDEAPIPYWSTGTDGRIRYANRAAAELFRYPLDELVGKRLFDMIADTPQGKPIAERVFAAFLTGRDTRDQELEFRTADGSAVWVRVSIRPLRNARGEVEMSRSMLVDVTDRKLAEQALKESQERLQRVLDSAMDGILVFNDKRRVEFVNRAAERLLRCSAADALGSPVDRFTTAEGRHSLEANLRRSVESNSLLFVDESEGLRGKRADGSTFLLEASLSRGETGGRTLYTIIFRDVDERKAAAREIAVLRRQTHYLRDELSEIYNFAEIVGQSAKLREVLREIDLVAPTDSTVLIGGETGTGKELVARAIHSRSARAAHPLIKVNCAAIPQGLLESELFGHERGAFTGATQRRIGRFELAAGGTLFLDEIGELPAEAQVKLLRVLQEREFERVGGSDTIRADVRLIAATNRDLSREVEEGRFREDLYYRLNVFPVAIPPLRERIDDVPLLTHYFVNRHAARIGSTVVAADAKAIERLQAYPWPGNVRELENVIERGLILSRGDTELRADVVLRVLGSAPASHASKAPAAELPAGGHALEEIERRHISTVLREANWRIEGRTGAAEILGLRPSTLRSRMRKLGIRRGA